MSISSRESGKITEHMYALQLKKTVEVGQFVKLISGVKDVDRVNLFSAKEELEY